MSHLKYCDICAEKQIYNDEPIPGFHTIWNDKDHNIDCPTHHYHRLKWLNISVNDFYYLLDRFPNEKVAELSQMFDEDICTLTLDDTHAIIHSSTDPIFIKAMIDLKKSDPIEFQIKVGQLKPAPIINNRPSKVEQKVKCPRCGSTQISTGRRGVGFFTGLLGANSTVNRCAKCGKTWHP